MTRPGKKGLSFLGSLFLFAKLSGWSLEEKLSGRKYQSRGKSLVRRPRPANVLFRGTMHLRFKHPCDHQCGGHFCERGISLGEENSGCGTVGTMFFFLVL